MLNGWVNVFKPAVPVLRLNMLGARLICQALLEGVMVLGVLQPGWESSESSLQCISHPQRIAHYV